MVDDIYNILIYFFLIIAPYELSSYNGRPQSRNNDSNLTSTGNDRDEPNMSAAKDSPIRIASRNGSPKESTPKSFEFNDDEKRKYNEPNYSRPTSRDGERLYTKQQEYGRTTEIPKTESRTPGEEKFDRGKEYEYSGKAENYKNENKPEQYTNDVEYNSQPQYNPGDYEYPVEQTQMYDPNVYPQYNTDNTGYTYDGDSQQYPGENYGYDTQQYQQPYDQGYENRPYEPQYDEQYSVPTTQEYSNPPTESFQTTQPVQQTQPQQQQQQAQRQTTVPITQRTASPPQQQKIQPQQPKAQSPQLSLQHSKPQSPQSPIQSTTSGSPKQNQGDATLGYKSPRERVSTDVPRRQSPPNSSSGQPQQPKIQPPGNTTNRTTDQSRIYTEQSATPKSNLSKPTSDRNSKQ